MPILRNRVVRLNPSSLLSHEAAGGKPQAGRGQYDVLTGGSFDLTLFDDLTYTVKVSRVEEHVGKSRSYVGRVKGQPDSSVTLTFSNEKMNARIQTTEGSYVIRPLKANLHVVEEIDTVGTSRGCVAESAGSKGDKFLSNAPSQKAPLQCYNAYPAGAFGIMVVYTPSLRGKLGQSGVDALVGSTITDFRSSLSDAGTQVNAYLAHSQEVNYTAVSIMQGLLERQEGSPSPLIPIGDLYDRVRNAERSRDPFIKRLQRIHMLAARGEPELAIVGVGTSIEWFLNQHFPALGTTRKNGSLRSGSITEFCRSDYARQLPHSTIGALRWLAELRNSVVHGKPPSNVYFCDPQQPWQRGSNENTNGLLRQYFPKGIDLANMHQNKLNAVARRLNERPRETLNFRTPAECFNECVASTG